MSFIIEQRAQFAVDIQALKERQAETARQQETNAAHIRQLVDISMSLAHHGEQTDQMIRELRESQAHSDRRLDALIDTVDKLIRRDGS
jgi:hypothetical protein